MQLLGMRRKRGGRFERSRRSLCTSVRSPCNSHDFRAASAHFPCTSVLSPCIFPTRAQACVNNFLPMRQTMVPKRDSFLLRRPASAWPAPGQGPAKARPRPGQRPANYQPKPSPGQGPASARPRPGQGPARAQPAPGHRPARARPKPSMGRSRPGSALLVRY